MRLTISAVSPTWPWNATKLASLVVTVNDGAGGPITFSTVDHTEFIEAFYRIRRDMGNKVGILTGATDFMGAIDFSTFLNDPDPDPDARFRVYD